MEPTYWQVTLEENPHRIKLEHSLLTGDAVFWWMAAPYSTCAPRALRLALALLGALALAIGLMATGLANVAR